MFISQSNLINEKLKQLKQETSSQNYEDYEVTMSAKRPTSLIVQSNYYFFIFYFKGIT